MAVTLNAGIANLEGAAKEIYTSLADGFAAANSEDQSPSFNPDDYISQTEVVDETTGRTYTSYTPNYSAINEFVSSNQSTQLKNSAYLFANTIDKAITKGTGEIDMSGLVSLSGDSMLGKLNALYGFDAGVNGAIVLSVNENLAKIIGDLEVSKNASIAGTLSLGNGGIYFTSHQSIYYDNDKVNIGGSLDVHGDITLDEDNAINIGSLSINKDGLKLGDYNYYHSGNCNNDTTDWHMKDGYVAGNLSVIGGITGNGGFTFSTEDGVVLCNDGVDTLVKNSLSVNQTIKLTDTTVLYNRSDKVISISAPGKYLNLGDAYGDVKTTGITLQADLLNDSADRTLIDVTGNASFSSLRVGVSDLSWVLKSAADGIIVNDHLYFEDTDGLNMSVKDSGIQMALTEGYINFSVSKSFVLANTDEAEKATFSTDASYFSFNKPVESEYFAIKSDSVKTTLQAGNLFLNDEVGIKSGSNYMHLTAETHIDDDLGTTAFRSGFAGSGWRISNSCATFDELVVRKKMKVYELEVSKQSVTNGSLWVSDSCSGDYLLE